MVQYNTQINEPYSKELEFEGSGISRNWILSHIWLIRNRLEFVNNMKRKSKWKCKRYVYL